LGNVFYFDWEVSLIEWLQNTLGPASMAITKVFNFIGGETGMLIVMLIMIFCYQKEAGMRCALKILTATMWFPMIKNIVLRVRPYIAHANVVDGQLTEGRVKALSLTEHDADKWDIVQQGYSFPSGHCANTVALYGGIAMEIRKRWVWIVAIVLTILIGISRVIAGVHYPTDVLAGWAVGLLAIGFCTLLEKKVKNEWMRYIILFVLSVPGVFWCKSRDYFSALGLLVGIIAAYPVEKKYINFQDTRNVWAMILRVVGVFVVYYVLNTLMKLPFSKEWLDSGELLPNLVRTIRYAIILFVALGVYPRVFPLFEKVGRKTIQN